MGGYGQSRLTVADVKLAMKFLDLSRFQRLNGRQIAHEAKEINRKSFIGQALADKRNKPPYHQPQKCDDLAERAKDGEQDKIQVYKDLQSKVNMNNLPQPTTTMDASCRLLIQPNYQVYSEELQSDLHENLKKRYGVPIRDRHQMTATW